MSGGNCFASEISVSGRPRRAVSNPEPDFRRPGPRNSCTVCIPHRGCSRPTKEFWCRKRSLVVAITPHARRHGFRSLPSGSKNLVSRLGPDPCPGRSHRSQHMQCGGKKAKVQYKVEQEEVQNKASGIYKAWRGCSKRSHKKSRLSYLSLLD